MKILNKGQVIREIIKKMWWEPNAEEEHWVLTQLDGLRRTKKRAVAGEGWWCLSVVQSTQEEANV